MNSTVSHLFIVQFHLECESPMNLYPSNNVEVIASHWSLVHFLIAHWSGLLQPPYWLIIISWQISRATGDFIGLIATADCDHDTFTICSHLSVGLSLFNCLFICLLLWDYQPVCPSVYSADFKFFNQDFIVIKMYFLILEIYFAFIMHKFYHSFQCT